MQQLKNSPRRLVTLVGASVQIQAPSEQLLPAGVSKYYLKKRLYLS
jgi:hypothetical protein